MFNFFIIGAGLIAGLLLFWKLPEMKQTSYNGILPTISVVIPMRNEEKNIVFLLSDLMKQTFRPAEIICVDDESADRSAAAAQRMGAIVLSVGKKPTDWVGKTYACQVGAQRASGMVLVFLDADVRLAPDALKLLATQYATVGCILSVQPFHHVQRIYEYFSLFPNIMQVASTGMGLPFAVEPVAFFGPVFAVARDVYMKHGGHSAVKGKILDDLMLCRHFAYFRTPSRLFIGGSSISFSMYTGGFRQLWQGWTKNIYEAATCIPLAILLLVVLLIAGYSTAVFVAVLALTSGEGVWCFAAATCYILCVLQIIFVSHRIGNFHFIVAIFYPVFLVGFILIFIASAFKKLILRKTKWKGRDVPL